MQEYLKYLSRSNWVEVDLDAVANNFNKLREMVGPEVKIMPAVKANAYGHGLLACCQVLEECGADVLSIGSVMDGIMLRKNGIQSPILIFAGNTVTEAAELYVQYDLMPTIMYYAHAESVSAAAEAAGKVQNVFVKVETGRGRLGINAEEAAEVILAISKLPNVKVAGVYTHLCDTKWRDEGNDYTIWQDARFSSMQKQIDAASVDIPFYQIANTAASIALSEVRHTGICPGRAIWGYSPLSSREEHPALHQALQAWKTRVILIKDTIGGKFGPNFKNVQLETPKRIGIIPCGLYDGVDHKQEKGCVLIRGKRVPVGSSMSLEHTILDLTDFPEVEVGDEVVVMGCQGEECISLKELSALWDRNLSEFLTGMNPHLPRVYFRGGKAVSIGYDNDIITL